MRSGHCRWPLAAFPCRKYPTGIEALHRGEDAVVVFGQGQIERASILGERQMQMICVNMLPTQRSGFHAAQPGQEQQPIICPVDRVKERRHLAVPLRKVIYAPSVWLLVVPFY